MNLHDWMDELCDALDLTDVEVDEALLADLAVTTTDQVHRLAAPVTAYLVGYAAALQRAAPQQLEELVERVQHLARAWDPPAVAVVHDDPPADGGGADYSGDFDLGIGDPDDLDDDGDELHEQMAEVG